MQPTLQSLIMIQSTNTLQSFVCVAPYHTASMITKKDHTLRHPCEMQALAGAFHRKDENSVTKPIIIVCLT